MVVTHNRRKFLCALENIVLPREAFRAVIRDHPFTIEAIVILPDHLHCVLQPGETRFSQSAP